MKHFRPLDFVLIAAILVSAVLVTKKSFTTSAERVIVNANGNGYEYSLNKDGIYEVEGVIGITKFEIKNKQVRILESPCPNKTCVNLGWSNPLICLPNKVVISVITEGDVDAVSQ